MAAVTDLPRNETGIATAIDTLVQRFGPRCDRSAAMRQQHGHTATFLQNQPPDAVVFVQSTEEVQEIARICSDLPRAHRALWHRQFAGRPCECSGRWEYLLISAR